MPIAKGLDRALVVETYNRLGSQRAAARELGIDRSAVSYHLHRAAELAPIPDRERSVEELKEAKALVFARRKAYEDAIACMPVKINIDGPFAICHFGDPHLDDDGCNIRLLEQHMGIVRDTIGMFAGSVGDYTNNWVGRLARLHGAQTITEREGWKLVEWFIGQLADTWLYLVGGNHDAWSGGSDPLRFIASQKQAPLRYHGARFELRTPSGVKFRVNTRHDHPGNSQWNVVHGAVKAAKLGAFSDDIYLCGHKHRFGYHLEGCQDPMNPRVSHCIRVATYKQFDDYARQLGLTGGINYPSCVTIFDPYETDPIERVTVRWNVERGAEELVRRRKAWEASRATMARKKTP